VLPLKLGKSYGALRVQVLRIRRALSECIAHCLNRGRGASNATDKGSEGFDQSLPA
jgi:hypothetical protein